MSYTKQNFYNDQVLTHVHLNTIESGIVGLEEKLELQVPQIYNAYPQRKSLDEQLKILCFGSSWFLNSWWYLNKITNNLGINAKIHGYFMGSSQFDEWIDLYNDDLTPLLKSRSKSFNSSENGADYSVLYNVTSATESVARSYRDSWYNDITSGDWDIIIFQQGALQAVKWDYWKNYDKLVSIIKRCCNPNTVIAFNSTWTPAVTSSYLSSATDNAASVSFEGQKIWQTINWNNSKKMMNLSGVYNVSPCGATLYTMRRDASLNTGTDDLAKDGLHPNNGLPMFGLACTLYESCVAPFYGISIKNCTWLPSTSTQKSQFSSAYTPINSDQAKTIFNHVRLALSNRFGFNEPDGKIGNIIEYKGTLLKLTNNTLNVTKEAMGNYGSENATRISSASSSEATGVLVKNGETITLYGLSSGTPTLRVDYLYASSAGPNETVSGVWEYARGVGNDGTADTYFPLNQDGKDSVSITNTYGADYYFFFAFCGPNKTESVNSSNYTISYDITTLT